MTVLQNTLSRIEIGAAISFRNLTLFPLLQVESGSPDYLVLDEALAQNAAKVTEVSAAGSVPELQFTNDSDLRILLLDGEELVGAKQNRILNLTLLIPAKTSLQIPVSCVEAGRWQHQSSKFSCSPNPQYAAGRARKIGWVTQSMRSTGKRHSNQRDVWADIDAKASRLGTSSFTQAMNGIYEQHASSLEKYMQAFSAQTNQVGGVFAINGEIRGMDLFDYSATFQKLLPKLVRSYALDALDIARDPVAKPGIPAQSILTAIEKVTTEKFPALGVGEDVRLSGAHIVGSALIADERVVHLSAFCT